MSETARNYAKWAPRSGPIKRKKPMVTLGGALNDADYSNNGDPFHRCWMGILGAVDWPDDVIRQEPGCSSRFQSYTAAAAAYAVALVAENALKMVDGAIMEPRVVSWVRGQRYLNGQRSDLALRDWAATAASHDGLLIEGAFP